jgi:hypothetical protein
VADSTSTGGCSLIARRWLLILGFVFVCFRCSRIRWFNVGEMREIEHCMSQNILRSYYLPAVPCSAWIEKWQVIQFLVDSWLEPDGSFCSRNVRDSDQPVDRNEGKRNPSSPFSLLLILQTARTLIRMISRPWHSPSCTWCCRTGAINTLRWNVFPAEFVAQYMHSTWTNHLRCAYYY